MNSKSGQTKKKSKVGLYLAIAALLVNGPRFIIVFLHADGILLPKGLEGAMLGITGLATGIVLTGGGAYISHQLADSQVKGLVKTIMAIIWLAFLIFSVILLAPLMVQSIQSSELVEVIDSTSMQWVWAVSSVLAVEVLASGAMAAYAIDGRKPRRYRKNKNPTLLTILVTAIAARIQASAQLPIIDQQSSQQATPVDESSPRPESLDEEPIEEIVVTEVQAPVTLELENRTEQITPVEIATPRAKNKKEAIRWMLEIFEGNPTISYTEVAEKVGRDKSTISGYLKELVEKGRIIVHDDRVEVVHEEIGTLLNT